jgi:hypothetical protein
MELEMAKSEKIDVHNRGSRTYTTPSGVHIQGGTTVQLDREEGEALLKGYPRDLISPDSLRSSPSVQSNADQHNKIVELQAKVTELEKSGVTDPKGTKRIAELEASILDIATKSTETIGELTEKSNGYSAALETALLKNEELTKALEEAKKLAEDAFKQIDELKNNNKDKAPE